MDNHFFEQPILNSPYEFPARHWELDEQGQPTQRIVEMRRAAAFITPIPKPRKRRASAQQAQLVFDEGLGLSSQQQQYDPNPIINELRFRVGQWRQLPNPADWRVTPETAGLLRHWRHHEFSGVRPFFCQVEALETAIWLTEVAPESGREGRQFLEHLANANLDANPELLRLAPGRAKELHAEWWQARIARQKEIDASISAKAEFEYLYDKPYEDRRTVRVAGPFTVESLSPHRVLGVDENDELIDAVAENGVAYGAGRTFPEMILEHLKTAGVQQANREDRITFTSLVPWPGDLVCAEGRFTTGPGTVFRHDSQDLRDLGSGSVDGGAAKASATKTNNPVNPVQTPVPAPERRAAIFIGPEFGTVTRPDLVQAAREAADAGFDVLIACAFNYEAHATEFNKLGRVPILKARMNADLHMADNLKNTGKGNLFVVFGEPDIDILPAEGGKIRVKVNGVDVFQPSTGEVRSDGPEGIACWFVDTDYNEESFFVRQAYFLGANDPYRALKTTLKAEIDEDAWATLHSDTSRPFDKPTSGRIAVKVINHLGDEVMKVFRVG